MALLMLALGWLGWLLLDQDISLKEQRIRERIDKAAVKLEDAFTNGLAAEQDKLNEIAAALYATPDANISGTLNGLTTRMTLIHFSADGITVLPETGLRYLPISAEPETLPSKFEQSDRLEFQHRDYQAAKQLLTPLAEFPDPHIQAAALMRLGRIDRRNGRITDALNAYEQLTGLSSQRVSTAPANWLGLYARCTIFEAENQMAELGVELNRLVASLTAGGQHVSAATYRYYANAAARWAGLVGQPETAQRLSQPHAPSKMAIEFLRSWNGVRQGATASSGIELGEADPGRMLGIWTTVGSDLLASILALDEFHAMLLTTVTDNMESRGIGWRISKATGQILLSSGSDPVSSPSLRSLTAGGMAFTVIAFETSALLLDSNDINRRQVLLTGLFLILGIIIASTFFIFRSLRREAEVSRLQSDFVAAVSHEFRTPLTSIRQLTELLAAGRVENSDKVGAYYRILEKETARLQRLVEGLLDFGRMEAGAHPYRPEKLNCKELLDGIVTAFREENDLTADTLSLEINGTPHVWIDKEAMTRTIWNLLDNAVKYSPETLEIEVKVQLEGNNVCLSIADHGVGIPTDEQAEIFSKFVRGSAAGMTNAKGTGMGLTMARKIIEDQGGSINVRNNPGGGSVFTIILASAEMQ